MFGNEYSYEIYLNGGAVDIRLDGISVSYYQGEKAEVLSEKLEEAQEKGQAAINTVCLDREQIISDWYEAMLGGKE